MDDQHLMRRILLTGFCIAAALMLGGFHQWSAHAVVKPYVTVTPSSPTAPSTFTISGCGFKASNGDLYVEVWHNPLDGSASGPGTTGYTEEPIVGADGCFSVDFSTTQWSGLQSGSYHVNATQERGPTAANYVTLDFTVQ